MTKLAPASTSKLSGEKSADRTHMANEAKITLSAVDQTKAAFQSVTQNLAGLQTKAAAVNASFAGAAGLLGAGFAAATFTEFIKKAGRRHRQAQRPEVRDRLEHREPERS